LGALYIPSPFGQKYRGGLVRDGERLSYISKGLGLFLSPFGSIVQQMSAS